MSREELRRVKLLTDLMDRKFRILGISFGLDPIIGLIPGIGDIVPAALSGYLIALGIKYKLPPEKLGYMIAYSLADWGLGLVPVLGDIADIFFRSYIKNYQILAQHLEESEK